MSELTPVEARAVKALQRLAKTWPRTLTLASMGGELVVVRTGDSRFLDGDTLERQEAVLDDIRGIPNS